MYKQLFLLFQIFDITVDLVKLAWNIDVLRTMGHALVAAYASVCLTEFRNGSVVAYKICTTGLPVVLRFLALGYVAFIYAFVVVKEDGRDVYTVWARHAVFAVVAWNCRICHHQIRRLFEEIKLVLIQRYERGVGLDVVLKVLHVGHAAENTQDTFVGTGKTEGP